MVKGESVYRLSDYEDMTELIMNYNSDKIQRSLKQATDIYALEEVKFMAPVTKPGKLIFVGLNYRDHAEESECPIPEYPILFSKYSNSLLGHGQNVIIPDTVSKCDFEAEFAFVIGKTAKNINVEDAMKYVFGYTICNDVSARDLQLRVSQWLYGKSIDTFAPMGPVIATADEIKDPHNLDISCRINGLQRQKSNTRELIFNVPCLLSYISRTITLEPGDIISTGTPAGVILATKDPVWLKDGDICEVEIEGIGVLRNIFANEK
jgi:2-keto-4-pentenoate hydratase/2-oxohepta-3-ene-1,7-dioic acid hydratase (catechol pathway)